LKIFAVGGVVRDQLLGLPSADADYVVVGSTPEEMVKLGFTPVGSDFPVFLHPKTKEEYALARTERKTGKGYKGFSFHADPKVTLEEDLARRDLTINAMAQEVDSKGHRFGPIIDPYGGQADLSNRTFRHVSTAFVEDPLRILRVARFAARFSEFEVHSETVVLLRQMVEDGELKDLVVERVWQEISRGLMEQHPSRMLAVLRQVNALGELFPKDFSEKEAFEKTSTEIDLAASAKFDLPLRFAALMGHVDYELAKDWYDKMRVPLEERGCAEIFRIWTHQYKTIDTKLSAQKIMLFFDRADLWRKPERILQIFSLADVIGLDTSIWRKAIEAVQKVDAGEIARSLPGQPGEQIKKAVYEARLKVVEASL
jgi:tRNA nucleotidyltransferase (CCA-adding enzyme)